MALGGRIGHSGQHHLDYDITQPQIGAQIMGIHKTSDGDTGSMDIDTVAGCSKVMDPHVIPGYRSSLDDSMTMGDSPGQSDEDIPYYGGPWVPTSPCVSA